jgi:hypothetical protein
MKLRDDASCHIYPSKDLFSFTTNLKFHVPLNSENFKSVGFTV